MKKETLKILVAVLRVFVDPLSRGTDVTHNKTEIINLVCAKLHKRKESEKKNAAGRVTAVLKALKTQRVLFEAIDTSGTDRIQRFASTDYRRVFSLTAAAHKYFDTKKRQDCAITSDAVLMQMLETFGVVNPDKPTAQTDNENRPAVLVEAAQVISQTAPQEPEMRQLSLSYTDDELQKLVNAVKHVSATRFIDETPADLLAALFEINALDAKNFGSCAKLGWSSNRNLATAAKPLENLGLIGWQSNRARIRNGQKMDCYYGIYLTPLGAEVVVAGNFKDTRPSEKITRKKPMLKAQTGTNKKQADGTTPAAVNTDDILRAVERMTDEERSRFSTLLQLRGVDVAPETPAEEKQQRVVVLNQLAAISSTLHAVAPVLIANILEALKKPAADVRNNWFNTESDEELDISPDSMYIALTEIEKVVASVKRYVSQYFVHDALPQEAIEELEAYAGALAAAAVNFGCPRREVPVLPPEQIVEKRVLTGVKHKIWKRATSAKT